MKPVAQFITKENVEIGEFAVVYVLPGGNFFHQIVDVSDNKCLFNGKIYS